LENIKFRGGLLGFESLLIKNCLLLDDSTAEPTAKPMDSAAEEIKFCTRLDMFRKDIVNILFF
jgi:hypothetical protein